MTTSNASFQAALRQAYALSTGEHRSIQLPDPAQFQLSGDKETLRLYLTQDAVTRNMQENVAAMEGWVLALKAWGCADKVVLDWQEPNGDKTVGHYQRFLYRVTRFREHFPDWFDVAPKKLLNESRISRARGQEINLLVNSATGKAKDTANERSREALLEKRLIDSGRLKETFRLKKIGRQFPVGLFACEVATSNRIFTAGKSAIDIVGIDQDDVLWVFELKAEGNQPLGIISELFFYTSMMRDLTREVFHFEDDGARPHEGRLHPREIVGIQEVRGCLLAPTFHPLLNDHRIVDLLNTGTETDGFCQATVSPTDLAVVIGAPGKNAA